MARLDEPSRTIRTTRTTRTISRRGALRGALWGAAGPGVVALAAACAAPGASTTADQAPAARKEPVSIDFNTWYTAVTDPIVPLFEKFEQEKRIKVRMDLNAANRSMEKYTAWYVSGTAPDVVNGDNFSWSTFYNSGVILELSDLLKRDKIDLRRDYSLMGSEIWCGKTYAMPYDADPRAVYYNKTLIKQAGAKDPWDDLKGQWTFDDMLEIMTKTSKVQGSSGTDVYGLRVSYNSMNEGNGMFVWSFGGRWADFDAMKYLLDSRESVEAHNLVYDWYNRKLIMPNAVATELGGDEKPIGQGRAVFRVRAAASHSVIRREIAGAFEYDIAPFPGRQRGQPGVTIVSGNPHTVSKTTKYPEESYEFVKWLAGDDVQGFWAREKVQLPTLKKWQPEYVKDPKLHTHVFADAYKVPYGIHFRHNNTVRHYNEYGTEINQVFSGQQSMADFLRQFTARVNNEVEFGTCAPYKGMAVPIKP
jgi:multiple sugar transport system substrate-binding protein